MHMADAMISPQVGAATLALATAVGAYSIHKLNHDDVFENKKIPMMGVSGAFIFAAQMINFAIPGTGSSGHLGGGLLLAALLGSDAGFLVLGAVLAIQALFFADGGLLAFGCNLINMGFFTCYIAYPIIMKPILEKKYSRKNIFIASISAAVIGLSLGAFGVVLETSASRITDLPFGTFASFMLPIHLAIGAVEGIVTALVLIFLNNAEPSLLDAGKSRDGKKRAVALLAVTAAILTLCVSRFVSDKPDGLEWSIERTAGSALVSEEAGSVMDYDGTFSGILGSGLVLASAAVLGLGVSAVKRFKNKA